MPGVPALLKVDIVADASKAVAGMKDTSDSASKLGSSFGKVAAVVGGALSVGAVVGFGAASVKAATESQIATNRLEQVMSSMGDTTGDAAAAAEKYASALSAKIGVEDETIMAGQAQLATFGSVSSETARMAGIFDRATAAGADLAAAGFGSIESNAVQLGKALEDPTKGMTALAKSGVTFTDSQKEQIKAMQESGDLLGAQKIVLGAVEKQVGGTAEATATSTGKMSVAFGEVQESVGSFLLPVISTLASILTKTVIPAIQDFLGTLRDKAEPVIAAIQKTLWDFSRDAWPKLVEAIKTVMPHIQAFATSLIENIVPAVKQIIDAVVKAAPPIISLAKDAFQFLAEDVLPKVSAAFEVIAPIVATIATKIIELTGWLAANRDVMVAILAPLAAYLVISKAISVGTAIWEGVTKAMAVAQGILNAVMDANPIMLVVIALVAIIAALWLAYNRVGWFRDIVDTGFAVIVGAFNFLKDAAVAVFGWISDNWPLLLAILLGPFGIAIGFVIKHFDTIMNIIQGVISWIASNWPLLLAILTGPIGLAVLFIVKNFDTLRDAATAVVGWVSDRFQDLTGFLSRIAGSIQGILSAIADAIRYPIDAATAMVNWVTDKFNALMDVVRGIKDSISNAMSGAANALKGPLNAVIRAWNGIQFTVPSVDVGPVHFGGQTIGVPDVPLLARGGMVMRTGMALVHEGEQFSGVGKTFGSSGNVTINVNTTGLGADAPQIQRAVVHALRGYTARNGALDLPIKGIA